MLDILRDVIQMFQDVVKQFLVRGVLTHKRRLRSDLGPNQRA